MGIDTSPKFCINCKYIITHIGVLLVLPKCSINALTTINLVTAKKTINYKSCESMRECGRFACGGDGKFFEQKTS